MAHRIVGDHSTNRSAFQRSTMRSAPLLGSGVEPVRRRSQHKCLDKRGYVFAKILLPQAEQLTVPGEVRNPAEDHTPVNRSLRSLAARAPFA
jgi:hypothetical protein